MLTCREILDFLMDYLDGSLSTAQRIVFEEHLAVCPTCVAYLHSYQQTVNLSKAIAQEKAAEAPEDLVQAILTARRGQ